MQSPTNPKGQAQTGSQCFGCEPQRGIWASGTEPLLSLPGYLKDRLPVKTDARPEILKKCNVIPTSYVMQLQAYTHTDVMNIQEKRHSIRTAKQAI